MKEKTVFRSKYAFAAFVLSTCFSSPLFSQTPGGVSLTDAVIWLKADDNGTTTTDNVDVTTWEDRSGNNYDHTDGASPYNGAAAAPHYVANGVNYNPSISFDNSNKEGLFYNGLNENNRADHSFYIVAEAFTNALGNDSFFALANNSSRRPRVHRNFSTAGSGHVVGGAGVSGFHIMRFEKKVHSLGPSWNWDVISFVDGDTAQAVTGKTSSLSLNDNNNTAVGMDVDANGHINADISEIILFRSIHGATDKRRIESYLALKYGLTLSNANGGVHGDYELSNGTQVWDGDLNSGYQNDILGLVRDGGSALNQKQSRTQDDSLRIYLGTLAANNVSNASTIGNNFSGLLVGHNGGKAQADAGTAAEVPVGVVGRFDREWKVTNTNFSNTFNIDITWQSAGSFNVSDLRLLIDTDGNFTNAMVINTPTVGISASGSTITITGLTTALIPMNSTRYFTIGTVDEINTPLPIELADFNVKPVNNSSVLIDWSTYTETNNNYFEIMRSANGQDWESIARVEGADMSSSLINYSYEDFQPLKGLSYYKLKQVDFNGSVEEFDPKSCRIEADDNVKLYPNPTNSILYLESENGFERRNIQVFNSTGRIVVVSPKVLSDKRLSIDVSALALGIYYVKLDEQSYRFVKTR